MEWKTVSEKIVQDDQNKWDRNVSGRELRISSSGALTMKSFVLEETHMFLKIISEEIWDVESGLKAGIMIRNSEVGIGSVSVEPFVFRKPCTNDLIVSREKSFRHAHIHLTAYELTRRMAEAVTEGFQVSS